MYWAFVAALIPAATAVLSDIVDVRPVTAAARSLLSLSELRQGDLKALGPAIEILKASEEFDEPQRSRVCDFLLKKANSVPTSHLAYLANVAAAGECKAIITTDQILALKELYQEALEDADLHKLYAAVLGLYGFGESSAVSSRKVLNVLGILASAENVLSSPEAAAPDFGNAFKAVSILKLLPEDVLDASLIDRLAAPSNPGLDKDPTLIADLVGLGASTPAGDVDALASDLAELLRSKDLRVALGAMKSLQSLDSVGGPLVVRQLSNGVVALKPGNQLQLEVSSLFGAPIALSKASLAAQHKTTDMIIKGSTATLDVSTVFERPASGDVEYAIQVEGRSSSVKVRRRLTLTTEIEIKSFVAGVSTWAEADDEDERLENLAGDSVFQNKHEGLAVENHHFHVIFETNTKSSGALLKEAPQQVFVQLHHKDSGVDTFFVADSRKKGKDTGIFHFEVSVALAKERDAFLGQSGTYSVTTIISDVLLGAPIVKELGDIVLHFPKKAKTILPIYRRKLQYESDTTNKPLEEKWHTFQDPPTKPPVLISWIFAALTAAPAILFMFGAGKISHANSKHASTVGNAFIFCISIVFVLLGSYWFSVPFVNQMEKLGAVLVPVASVTVILGLRTLWTLIEERSSPSHLR